MAIREGKWRCPYCATVNAGRDLVCSGCGATRDEDVTFFLEDEAAEVTDAALLKTAQAGADWVCQFCDTSNRPDQTHCANCGAEKGTSPSRPVKEVPTTPAAPTPEPQPSKSRKGCGKWLLGIVLLLILLVGTCSYFSFRKTDEPVTVTGFEWQRTIEVEELRTVRESAWEGEVPRGARILSSSREVHHNEREQVGTERVKTGTRDLGNGFFEDVYEDRPVYEESPVYRDKVTYEVERWVTDRTEKATGRDRSPGWPAVSLDANEREGERSEGYFVLLQGDEETYRMPMPLQRWSGLSDGESFTATVQGGDEVLELR
ncbi:MAG TPA: zinc finger protein [Thermoanaerobaculia bacterium]|nr:zinc finger protein [Thermoanaerobaculia bacterium]